MRRLGLLLSLLLVAMPEWAACADDASDDGTSSEIELTGPGQEMTIEADEPVPKPKPAPVPAPAPKPKPAPKPAPKPKPAPPRSPWEWLVLEDFDGTPLGRDVGALRRPGGDLKPQFGCRVVAQGHDGREEREGKQGLVIEGIPALAEGTVWSWTPPDGKPRDLSRWRGIHLWAKASQAAGELRLGAAGGGSVFTTAALGTEWTEVWLDFSRDPGCGRFDPARVTEIALTVAHELTSPVEVVIDTIAAWKERVPSGALRLGLNVPPLPGPGDWNPDFRTVNCAGRSSVSEGLVLSFWSAAVPYQPWPIVATWRELPRGLEGAGAIIASVRLEPAQPAVLLRFTLVEKGGEQFSALRALPADAPTLRIPVKEFVWDAVANLRIPPPEPGNGLLDPAAVAGWRLEVVPATERQCRGTVFVKELWAEGSVRAAAGAKPAKVAEAPASARPAAATAMMESAPKPAARPAAAAEDESIEDGAAPEAAGAAAPSGEPPAAAEGSAEPQAAPAAKAEPGAAAEETAPEGTDAAPTPESSPAPEAAPAPESAPAEPPPP